LFIGSPNIGGNIAPESVIHGYTEIKLDGNIICSHPSYSNIGCWYDWAFFRWQGFEREITARIMMILDLSKCEINYERDVNPDITSAARNAIYITIINNIGHQIIIMTQT
jgi:hypothetical protein